MKSGWPGLHAIETSFFSLEGVKKLCKIAKLCMVSSPKDTDLMVAISDDVSKPPLSLWEAGKYFEDGELTTV